MALKKFDKLVGLLDRHFKEDLENYDKLLEENTRVKAENRSLKTELERAKLSKVKNRQAVIIMELEQDNKEIRKYNDELLTDMQNKDMEIFRFMDEIERLKRTIREMN